MRSASRFLLLLLGLTLGLAGLLGVEALRATRSHRVTAERALRDYATVAAWELLGATDEELQRAAGAVLGPIVGAPAASPYDSVPSAAALPPAADSLLPCGATGDSARFSFSLDLRTAALATRGAVPAPALRTWLSGLVAREARAETAGGGRYALRFGMPGGPAAGRLVVFGVKPVRYNGYAAHDAPLAVYGVVTCAAAIAPLVSAALARHPVLPAQVTGGLPADRLVALQVADPAGHVLLRVGPPAGDGAFAGDPASSAALVVRASLPAAVAGRLVVASPASRLPLLFGLFLVTAGLTAAAAWQVRREHELARLRQDFTSSVSHELRTPLTQILLFGETLELGRAGGEDARREAVSVIVQEARRLQHLVENVLHLSRAERQMVRVHPRAVPLAPLLREIVERFAPLAGADAIRLRTELEESLVADADPDALHQIVINLLDNAVKHGGQGPVTLRAALRGDRAVVEVEDDGPGIAPRDRVRVWDPFVRLTPSAAVPGSGIGLAVVRELVVAHGGRCRVEAGQGGGARFVIELPGARRAALPAEQTDTVEAAWRRS